MTTEARRHHTESLPFERRQINRWPLEGAATAFELGGEAFGQMHTLRLLDFSDRGVGVISDTMIAPGTTVSIGFDRPDCVARRADVIRCEPCGEGYRVAMRFQARMAA